MTFTKLTISRLFAPPRVPMFHPEAVEVAQPGAQLPGLRLGLSGSGRICLGNTWRGRRGGHEHRDDVVELLAAAQDVSRDQHRLVQELSPGGVVRHLEGLRGGRPDHDRGRPDEVLLRQGAFPLENGANGERELARVAGP
jgi:hypothetical protein